MDRALIQRKKNAQTQYLIINTCSFFFLSDLEIIIGEQNNEIHERGHKTRLSFLLLKLVYLAYALIETKKKKKKKRNPQQSPGGN